MFRFGAFSNDGNRAPVPCLLNKMAALTSKKRPESNRVFALRRYLIGFLFVVIFVLLDRTTVYLQILPGISAWYPPVGIALALLLGIAADGRTRGHPENSAD